MNQLKNEILVLIHQFLNEKGIIVRFDDLPDYDFAKAGDLDSFEILTLIMSLEHKLEYSVPIERLVAGENTKISKFLKVLDRLNDDSNQG